MSIFAENIRQIMNTGIKQTESTSSCASAPDSTSRPMLLVRHPLVKKFHKNPSLTISKIRIIGLSSSCKNSVGTFLYPHLVQNQHQHLTSCRWAAATVCPRPLPPPWAPKRLARPSRRQRSSSFSRPTRSHADRCSCLTRQHGGE